MGKSIEIDGLPFLISWWIFPWQTVTNNQRVCDLNYGLLPNQKRTWHLVMTNSSPWKIPTNKWRFLAGKIIYFYGLNMVLNWNSHDGSMVLLYMVTFIYHQYTPVMLALIYQHHGSVMGYGLDVYRMVLSCIIKQKNKFHKNHQNMVT